MSEYPYPAGGYVIPPPPQQFTDPLISADLGGWWKNGLSIAKRGWRPLAALQAISLALVLLIQAPIAIYEAVSSQNLNQFLTPTDPGQSPDFTALFTVIGLTLLGAVLAAFLSAVVTIATIYIGASVAVGAPPRVSDALRLAGRRIFPLIGWELVTIPIYLAGFILCILPIFYVAAVFFVLPVVVAVERTNVIGRCFSLFHRNVGVALARIATLAALGLGVSAVTAAVSAAIGGAVKGAAPGTDGVVAAAVVSSLLGAVISGAFAILSSPLILATYADMRARVEPINTVVIAQQLGIVPTAPPMAQPWSSWPSGPSGPAEPAWPSWPTGPTGPAGPAGPPTS